MFRFILSPHLIHQILLFKFLMNLLHQHLSIKIVFRQRYQLVLIIGWILNTDLFANFRLNVSNDNAIFVADCVSFQFSSTDTVAHLLRFIAQTATINREIEFIFCFRKWPQFYRFISVNDRRWAGKIWNLNLKKNSFKNTKMYANEVSTYDHCAIRANNFRISINSRKLVFIFATRLPLYLSSAVTSTSTPSSFSLPDALIEIGASLNTN